MSVTNIVRAVVKPGSNYTVTSPIMKEHRGQILLIEGLELPEIYEIDFSNDRHQGSSVTMIGNAEGVLIPTQFIKTGRDVYAFYYYVGDNFGQTEHIFRLPNSYRPDRTDIQPTPEEQSTIDQLISALNGAVERAEDAQEAIENVSVSAATLAEGSFATVNKTERDGVIHLAFGIPKGATGDDGYSPTASVTKVGDTATITITDKNGTTTAQISDGSGGGSATSPTASVAKVGDTATITITDINGTTTATVSDGQNGTNGTNGSNGADGTTFTPSVSSAGVISWTNDGNKQNPSSVDLVAAIPTATTQTAGKMSATDKGRLDTLYADYSSALTALGVI